ncbi:amidohydrolase [Salibacterium aidingense]|uniref:amidohydrolase n=1 Tax=Salibacterium aidingense TaxID=384933 RepID=UPI000425553B|nr:amidohydrolase [Salibacterium aidingense]
MTHFIMENIHLVRPGTSRLVQKNSYVEVQNGEIVEIGNLPVPNKKKEHGRCLDGGGKWVMPGFYNTHAHTPMSLLRGVADDLPLKKWLEQEIWPREARLDKKKVEAGTSLALAEMIRSGTVAFLDMYHLHMDSVFQLTMEAGMKAVLSRGMIGFGSTEELSAKLDEAVQLALTWNESGKGRVKGMLFPHAPYTCPPDFLREIIKEAKRHQLSLGTHVAETAAEVEDHRQQYGVTPLFHLEQLGFYEQPSVLTHLVHVTKKELEMLQNKPVSVSHNPMSNAKLGSGIAPVDEMAAAGLHLTLGTDSTASNNNLDMFEEMRFASLLQKGKRENPSAVRAADIVNMATIHGAKTLGFAENGLLTEGARADFIMVNPEAIHLHPEQNILSHLVYAMNGQDVTDVFVEGKQLMKDRELLTLDEERIRFEANACYNEIIAG